MTMKEFLAQPVGTVVRLSLEDFERVVKRVAQTRWKEKSRGDITASIRENGIRVPVTVHYVEEAKAPVLVAGYNRVERYVESGAISGIPVLIAPPLRLMADAVRLSFTDNAEREGLSPMDFGAFIARARKAKLPDAQISAELQKLNNGKAVGGERLNQLVALLDLPEPMKRAIDSGVPDQIARLSIPDPRPEQKGKHLALKTLAPEAIERVLSMAQDIARFRLADQKGNVKGKWEQEVSAHEAMVPRASEVKEAFLRFAEEVLAPVTSKDVELSDPPKMEQDQETPAGSTPDAANVTPKAPEMVNGSGLQAAIERGTADADGFAIDAEGEWIDAQGNVIPLADPENPTPEELAARVKWEDSPDGRRVTDAAKKQAEQTKPESEPEAPKATLANVVEMFDGLRKAQPPAEPLAVACTVALAWIHGKPLPEGVLAPGRGNNPTKGDVQSALYAVRDWIAPSAAKMIAENAVKAASVAGLAERDQRIRELEDQLSKADIRAVRAEKAAEKLASENGLLKGRLAESDGKVRTSKASK